MNITKWTPFSNWDPFKEMEEMQSRLAPLFGRLAKMPDRGEEMKITAWAPPVDITEDEKEYLIKAELSEVRKEDVKVTVLNGMLTLSGERKFEKEEKDKKYHCIERSYGSFLRSFTLPEGANAGKVTAEFKDGVLTVHLPKEEKGKTPSVEVKVQ